MGKKREQKACCQSKTVAKRRAREEKVNDLIRQDCGVNPGAPVFDLIVEHTTWGRKSVWRDAKLKSIPKKYCLSFNGHEFSGQCPECRNWLLEEDVLQSESSSTA